MPTSPAASFSLAGRVALVTGASSGLGRHFARVLAGAGARVVVGARREDRLAELAAGIEAGGGEALAVPLDVTAPDTISAALDAAEAAFGTVDVVVNNAGTGHVDLLLDLPAEAWSRVLDVNLTGVHRVATAAVQRLVAAGRPGSIINIASVLGRGVAAAGGPYCASKAAVLQLTRVQALEWARHGVRANALCPGYFPSEMTADFLDSEHFEAMLKRIPMRRIGRLEELDGPLLLLASEASSFMTGSSIEVDGGHLCSSL